MPTLETRLTVEVDEPGLSARLFANEPYPDHTVRIRHVQSFLAAQGVSYGLDPESLERFLELWRDGALEEPIEVARGEAAVAGGPETLRRLHPPARTGRDAVELLPLYVKAGEAVIALDPAGAGTPGRTVGGDTIDPPAPPPRVGPTPGPGLEVEQGIWKARRTGFLVEHDDLIDVSPTLTQLRDLPAGSYIWDGDAAIQGAIPRGTTLTVAGSLRVVGDIADGVHLEAGKSIFVLGDVDGGGTTHIESAADVHVRGVRGATIMAEGNLLFDHVLDDTQVRTRLRVIATGPKATVIGGRLEAVAGVSLVHVGDERNTRTIVSVGHSDWVDEELLTLERQVRRWNTYYTKLYQDFCKTYRHLLECRSRIYRLSARERKAYESAHESVLAEQKRVDEKISDIRTQQTRLHKKRARDDAAVVRLEGDARLGVGFCIRGKNYHVPADGISAVTLLLSQSSGKVLPIPTSLVDSSEMLPGAECVVE